MHDKNFAKPNYLSLTQHFKELIDKTKVTLLLKIFTNSLRILDSLISMKPMFFIFWNISIQPLKEDSIILIFFRLFCLVMMSIWELKLVKERLMKSRNFKIYHLTLKNYLLNWFIKKLNLQESNRNSNLELKMIYHNYLSKS